MCIILTCDHNVRPDRDLIETCFWNNPDGAGVMWCEDGKVITSKGYMDLKSLIDVIEWAPKNSRMVIHMRIATSGGIDVGTCHPFPVCNDLDMLHAPDVECAAAIAHNGVIAGMPTDEKLGISDTVYFVQHVVDRLYHESGEFTKSIRRQIGRNAPGNRFALMTGDGEVYRIGAGWETVSKGIQASNSSWRYSIDDTWRKYLKWESEWDDEWEDDWNDKRADEKEDDFYYDYEYEEIFKLCCGDCSQRGTCMAYGPVCNDVDNFVKEWATYEKNYQQVPLTA